MLNQNKIDLLVELVRTNFKLRYNESLLGFLWVLLKPLLTFLILYFVFSRFKSVGTENYPMYLLIGIVVYTFFQEGITYGITSLLSKAHIILKVNFPRNIAVYSSIVLAVINLLINFLIILVFGLWLGLDTNIASILYVIFNMISLLILITGISFFTSILLVKFRDLENISQVLLQLLFYATPIIYTLNFLPEKINMFIDLYPKKILLYNPLVYYIEATRAALINGDIIYFNENIIIFILSLLFLALGYIFFKNNVRKIAENF